MRTWKPKKSYFRFVKGRKQLVHKHKQRYRQLHRMAAAAGAGLAGMSKLSTYGMAAGAVLNVLSSAEGFRSVGSSKDRKKIAYFNNALGNASEINEMDYANGRISYEEYRAKKIRLGRQIARFSSFSEGKSVGREKASVRSNMFGSAGHMVNTMLPVLTEHENRKEIEAIRHKANIAEENLRAKHSMQYAWEAPKAQYMAEKASAETITPIVAGVYNIANVNAARRVYPNQTYGEHDTKEYGASANDPTKGPYSDFVRKGRGGPKSQPGGPAGTYGPRGPSASKQIVDMSTRAFVKSAESAAARHGFPPRTSREEAEYVERLKPQNKKRKEDILN